MVSLKYLHAPMIRVPTCLSLKLYRFFTMHGHYHWVTVVCTEGKLYLCDSLASDKLTQTLEESIRVLFQNSSEDNVVTIHRLPVQQQKKGSMNCGIYAYAFHAANGDDLCLLSFEEEQMRTHLLQCY